jgi:hypothetical protein
VIELTDQPAAADFFLVPHNYFNLKNSGSYLGDFLNKAKNHGKRAIIFAYGDSAADLNLPEAAIFRTSQYGFRKKPNEIMMPGYVEDLADSVLCRPRSKTNRPVVGFCGWADFKNWETRLKYYAKILLGPRGLERQGLYYRRRALKILAGSGKVTTNFIIRKSYSGHSQTIELSPQQARSEYLANILGSDLVLCVKGDGNFSYRFYETLSLGRLPLFVDTDCPLPLDDLIPYRDFVLAVNWQDLPRVGDLVASYFSDLTAEAYLEKQRLAREVFEKYLRIDKYFEFMFGQKQIYNYLK